MASCGEWYGGALAKKVEELELHVAGLDFNVVIVPQITHAFTIP